MDPISPLRAALAAFALAASSLAAPASAQVGPRAVAVYPVAAASSAAGDAADVQSLLDPALHRAAQRSEDVLVASPLVTRGTCGLASAATPQCLAGLAAGGLVLRVTVHRSEATIVALMELVDARARTFGPVTVSVDAFAQTAEPLANGLLMLVEQAVSAARPKADLRAAPPPAVVTAAPPPSVPRAWMRTAGPWLTGAGAALLAGGVAVSVMSGSLSDDLARKYEAGALSPADRSSYRRVERYDSLTRLLLASGGAFALTGIAVWTSAPARGTAVAGVAGRF